MPVFFFFNQDVANLFAGGPDVPPGVRYRDFGAFFPLLLLIGSCSGAPQLVLPVALYMLLGSQVNRGIDNGMNSSLVKAGVVLLIMTLILWDFLPAFDEPELEVMEEGHPPHRHAYEFDHPDDDGLVVSALSEISLVFFISVTIAVLSHWEDIHSYIVRSLPRSMSTRFREFTRRLGIHPSRANSGLNPATPEAISALETVKFTTTDSANGECSVCLESFKQGESAKKLPCKHLFHTPCVMPWLAQRSSCPVCRASVEQSEDQSNGHQSSPRTTSTPDAHPGGAQSGDGGGLNAVWNALRSVVEPTSMFTQIRVDDRDTLMQLPIRELRERAGARNISLDGIVEKHEIVDLLLGAHRSH